MLVNSDPVCLRSAEILTRYLYFNFLFMPVFFGRQCKLLGTSESDNPIRIKLTNTLNPNSFETTHCKASIECIVIFWHCTSRFAWYSTKSCELNRREENAE